MEVRYELRSSHWRAKTDRAAARGRNHARGGIPARGASRGMRKLRGLRSRNGTGALGVPRRDRRSAARPREPHATPRALARGGAPRTRPRQNTLVGHRCGLLGPRSRHRAVGWRGFEWVGRQTGLPKPVWELGVVLWWAVPALIAAGAVIFERRGRAQELE